VSRTIFFRTRRWNWSINKSSKNNTSFLVVTLIPLKSSTRPTLNSGQASILNSPTDLQLRVVARLTVIKIHLNAEKWQFLLCAFRCEIRSMVLAFSPSKEESKLNEATAVSQHCSMTKFFQPF
jgi:hypothetical protein